MDLINLNIPKSKVNQLESKGINSIEELARFKPNKYIDFRKPIFINQVADGQMVSIIVKLTNIYADNKKQYVKVKSIDCYGTPLNLIWFNSNYIIKQLNVNDTYIICGKVTINYEYNNQVQMVNPLFISNDIEKFKKIMPIYPKIKSMSSEYLIKCIDEAINLLDNQEYLEDDLINEFNLMHEMDSIYNTHNPKDISSIRNANKRFIFDILFQYQFQLEKKSRQSKTDTDIFITKFDEYTKFLNKLPFELTKDQASAMTQLIKKMKSHKKINTLLTADVGAGKTVIAFLLMIILAENEYQGVLMAPTSVLARQHFDELEHFLKETPFKVCFLNGHLKAKEKKKVLEGIKSGDYQMIVGTHAVIQKDVEFQNLGIAIVDEEHRFGVEQRNTLINKTKDIHYMTMSATPIPRSLALTMYGDSIDILTILSMPNGRKPIKTTLLNDKKKSYQFMYEEIKKGHQCYFVCPLIERSYSEAMENIDAVEDIYKEMMSFFNNTTVKIATITGRMKEEEVNETILKFKNNEFQIVIATTVIEVGVNIPNATVMVINNAERFGLAQLHQLRGRVGRSSLQSYCLLISKSGENNERLNIMTTTNNGFKIAEEDLAIRGSGNLIGEKQSGDNEFIELLLHYPNFFNKIKEEIKKIYGNKKRLKRYNLLLETDENLSEEKEEIKKCI